MARAKGADGGSWRAVLAWNDLPAGERKRVLVRVKDGLRSTDATVRDVAARIRDDVVIADMDSTRPSDHVRLELLAARWTRRPLDDGAPVPGCGCDWCLADPRPVAFRAQLDGAKATVIARALADGRITTDDLADFADALDWWADATARQLLAEGQNAGVPEPLSALANAPIRDSGAPVFGRPRQNGPEPGKPRGARRLDALDVDRAREIPILDVAARLGLDVNRAGYAHCPFHDDARPSLHVNARRGYAWCNPCGRRWDGVAFTMQLHALDFPAAVRWLAA